MSDIQQITSKLWEMANDLRGSMDASEYKNYILAFMLSLSFRTSGKLSSK